MPLLGRLDKAEVAGPRPAFAHLNENHAEAFGASVKSP
jgi:hypothetical protein